MVRDANYNITGLKETAIPKGGPAREYGYPENIYTYDMDKTDSSKENSAVEENADHDDGGTNDYMNSSSRTYTSSSYSSSTAGRNNADKEKGASEQNDSDSRSVLKRYEGYGIKYNPSKDLWEYKGKKIAGLIDGDYIFISESAASHLVYLQIRGGVVKEISKKMFEELLETVG